MTTVIKEGFLRCKWSPNVQSLRWRRVNVQRPRAPHYERALTLALLQPKYDKLELNLNIPKWETCMKVKELQKSKERPNNPLERILARELKELFDKKRMIGLLHANPFSGDEMFNARVKLKPAGMTLDVYSKHIAKIAFERTSYEAILQLFVAHNALLFCDAPKVGVMLKLMKRIPQFTLMAGIVDGRLLSLSQLQAYSQLGDITTTRAQLVATLNSVGSHLTSHCNQVQTSLVASLDQYADMKSKPDS